MKKSKQFEFFKTQREHGGKLAHKRRKEMRPLTVKEPIHIVLRSDKAEGSLSLLNHQNKINKLIQKWALNFRISVYEKALAGNHIHLLIRGKTRKGIQDFFRTIASLIARLVTSARKGKPFGKFWSYLLYSRCISSWGKEFLIVKNYILQNTLEVLGIIPYQKRNRQKKFRTNSS